MFYELQKKIKKSDKNTESKKFITEGIKNSQSIKEDPLSSASEVNEYLSKINSIVYRHFYPPMNSQGHSVKAIIELDLYGKVIDFRILNYSANQYLNEECDKIKTRLMGVIFPQNPHNRSSRTIIVLTAKE